MRGPQIVALLWLAFAGLSFSGSVRYQISAFDFLPPYAVTSRIFPVPPGDTLRIVVPNMRNLAVSGGKVPLGKQGPSGVIWGITSQSVLDAKEFYENGCKEGHYYNVEPQTSFFYPPDYSSTTMTAWLRNPVHPTLDRTFYSQYGDLDDVDSDRKNGCTRNPNSYSIGAFGVRYITGPADSTACSVPDPATCLQCAYPYYAVPDTMGCGCKLSVNQYQTQQSLKFQCVTYCNSTPINGNQAYIDWSRSNFDVNVGTITCACSDRQTVVYRPTTSCPAGTNPNEDVGSDTGLQKVEYDPTTNPNLRDTSSSSGSGGGTGQYDSSSNAHLARIDSILGNITDTTGVQGKIDSLLGKGKYDSAIGHDTSAIKAQIGELQGDTSKANTQGWFNGTQKTWRGHDCWQCDTIPDTSIVFDFHVFGTEIKDTLPIGISPVMTGLGFDFWPWLRALEWLCVVLVMFPICINIAGGTTGKDAV